MHVLLGDDWSGGYLDYHLGEGQVRVDVQRWALLDKLDDQYIQYSASNWRRVVNYLWELGPVAVAKKIVSRLRERGRNRKWMSVGLGRVDASRSDEGWEAGQPVAFLASNHPRCVDRLVVDERFVVPHDGISEEPSILEFFGEGRLWLSDSPLTTYRGWTRQSGWSVEREAVEAGLLETAERLRDLGGPDRRLSVDHGRTSCERVDGGGTVEDSETLKATLFGLGNYAKSVIMPSLPEAIELATVHELDPLQLGEAAGWEQTVDTSGELRDTESCDVLYAAGYHHSHTPLAVEMLRRGGTAVVEKPLCTTEAQFDALRRAMETTEGRLFSGFHKRYSRLNEWLAEDIDLRDDRPVDYHCIVYEIPLPELHWYNWPASGSRIVSNGCHWLDHFMYLNGYAGVRDRWIRRMGRGQLQVGVELENSASMSMLLTDEGSSRLGVRDHVEVRAGDVTATMIDNTRYESENSHRVLQSRETNRMDSYRRMYRQIAEDIAAGEPGDSMRSLRSTRLMLELESELSGRDSG